LHGAVKKFLVEIVASRIYNELLPLDFIDTEVVGGLQKEIVAAH